jgi:hypothetical protein
MHVFHGFIVASVCFSMSIRTLSAQSIVGKWKRSTTKVFTRDKVTGKQVPLSADAQKQFDDAAARNGYQEILDMKADNTCISTVTTTGSTPMNHQGNYTLAGKDLDMHIPLVKGEKTTITISSLTKRKWSGTCCSWANWSRSSMKGFDNPQNKLNTNGPRRLLADGIGLRTSRCRRRGSLNGCYSNFLSLRPHLT